MVLRNKFLILHHDDTNGLHLLLPIAKLAYLTCVLPSTGFIFCILWSIIYDFEDTTATHCKVWNLLPSLSAAIGNNTVQYIVWCTTITLHAPSRFLFIALYYRRNKRILKPEKQFLARLACFLNILENISLLGLTYLTSTSAYFFHEKFFFTFVLSSEGYMLLSCMIFKYMKSNYIDKGEIFSARMKNRLLVINVVSFLIAGYFFIRHNDYCEPGMYSFFALFEYIVVLSNIAFHTNALIDFKEEFVKIYKHGIEMK